MICTICLKPIVLVPSAAERARKNGGSASDYTALFTTHAACWLAKRDGPVPEHIKPKREYVSLGFTKHHPFYEGASCPKASDQ